MEDTKLVQLEKIEIMNHISSQNWNSLSSTLLNSSDPLLIIDTGLQILASISPSTPIPENFLEFLKTLSIHLLSLPQPLNLHKKLNFLDEILKILTPIVSLKDSELGQLKLIKSRPKTLPLISIFKIEDKIKVFEQVLNSFELEYETALSKAKSQEQQFLRSSEEILENVNELNERIICLNEEVLVRLDLYLQTQSKMFHHFKKVLNEQENTVKSYEGLLSEAKSEYQANINSLHELESEKRPIWQFFYFSIIFFICGFIFSSTFYKAPGLILKPNPYY